MDDPQIGQLADSLYAANDETFWTEQTGLVIGTEPNPITKKSDFVLIFSDGGRLWTGKESLKNVRWPE